MSFLSTVWLVVRKDFVVEFRNREIAYTTLFFAVSTLLVFSFGFVHEGRAVQDAAASDGAGGENRSVHRKARRNPSPAACG
jgi:hypothetical protein